MLNVHSFQVIVTSFVQSKLEQNYLCPVYIVYRNYSFSFSYRERKQHWFDGRIFVAFQSSVLTFPGWVNPNPPP